VNSIISILLPFTLFPYSPGMSNFGQHEWLSV